MTLLVIFAIIFFYILIYGGTIVFGGWGIWLFLTSLKTRDQQKCIVVAVTAGVIFYALLVAIPEFACQVQLDRMPGQPIQKMQAISKTPLGKFLIFSSFLGTGLSLFFAGLATRFVPETETVEQKTQPFGITNST